MLPYFFATGHSNCARYETLPGNAWCSFCCSPSDVHERGSHIDTGQEYGTPCSATSFGDQTYIRYGKAKCGFVGITLNPDQVAGWVLSYHICNTVSLAMDDIFDKEGGEIRGPHVKHKEEGLRSRRLDADDSDKIK